MVITKLQVVSKNPKLVNLTFDNKDKFAVYKDVIVKFRLKNGDTISDSKLTEILYHDEFYRAKDLALKYFSYRQRTEFELKQKLIKDKFNMKVINGVIQNLSNIGLINDKEYAENFIQETLKRKFVSKLFLKQKLFKKGINKDIIYQVLENAFKNIDEEKFAILAAKKQLKKYQTSRKKYDKKYIITRLARYLTRIGYSIEIVSRIIRKLFKNQSFDE